MLVDSYYIGVSGGLVASWFGLYILTCLVMVLASVSPAGFAFVAYLLAQQVPFSFSPEMADGSGRSYLLIPAGFESSIDHMFLVLGDPVIGVVRVGDELRVLI